MGENDFIAETVPNLILQSRRAIEPLETLFHSPLNCDKIEGNYRTLLLLDRENIDPYEISELFVMIGDEVSIEYNKLCLIKDFWEKERDAYWQDIYTSSVFSAEAMLSRALEIYFEGTSDPAGFLFYTDKEALELLRTSDEVQPLITDLQENRLFHSLTEMHAEIMDTFGDRLRLSRFDKGARSLLEGEIASELGLKKQDVISHFSRRKYFNSRFRELEQMELFQRDAKYITLGRVSGAFQNSKKSGDFFDVFFRGANEP